MGRAGDFWKEAKVLQQIEEPVELHEVVVIELLSCPTSVIILIRIMDEGQGVTIPVVEDRIGSDEGKARDFVFDIVNRQQSGEIYAI